MNENRISHILPEVERVEVEVHANPVSAFSRPYTEFLVLDLGDELKIILKCPNGSCTEKVYVFSSSALMEVVRESLETNSPIKIERECNGWEDEKRIGKFHCGTRFILIVRCLRKSLEV